MFTSEVNEGMIAFNCKCIGVLHKSMLKSTARKNLIGKVISSFPSSLNIMTSRNDLMVISLNKIRSPITINLKPQFRNSNFAGLVDYGFDVSRTRDCVLIGEGILLYTAKSTVFKNSFVKPIHTILIEFCEAADKILSSLMKLRRGGCLLEADITNQGLLYQFISETLENNIRNKDDIKFVTTLSHSLMKMCGRGPGFTPSGDDFICGFSSLFNWLSQSLKCPPVSLPMENVYDLTTWISFKFIGYYQKLIVDEQIQGLINSIGEGRTDRYMSLLSTLSSRGHTSGIDIGIGLSTALFTFGDRFLGTDLLPKVQSLAEGNN
jgi:Protein of unknown function (DUF2877)